MKTLNQLAILLLSVLFALSLTACGSACGCKSAATPADGAKAATTGGSAEAAPKKKKALTNKQDESGNMERAEEAF